MRVVLVLMMLAAAACGQSESPSPQADPASADKPLTLEELIAEHEASFNMHAIPVESFDPTTVFASLPADEQARRVDHAKFTSEVLQAWDGDCPHANDDAQTIQEIRSDIKAGRNEDAGLIGLGISLAYFAGDPRAVRCELDVVEKLAEAEQSASAKESLYITKAYGALLGVVTDADLRETERVLQIGPERDTQSSDQPASPDETPMEQPDILRDVGARLWREAALQQHLINPTDIPD